MADRQNLGPRKFSEWRTFGIGDLRSGEMQPCVCVCVTLAVLAKKRCLCVWVGVLSLVSATVVSAKADST